MDDFNMEPPKPLVIAGINDIEQAISTPADVPVTQATPLTVAAPAPTPPAPTPVMPPRPQLTPAEEKKIADIQQATNLADSATIMQYGSTVQNQISKFSDSVLQSVRTKDTGEIGKDLSQLVSTIKDFDSETDKKTGFSLFKKARNNVDRLLTNFSSVESNIDKIVSSLESHKRTLLKDVHMLDTMYNNNYEYFKELSLYVVAGEEKLAHYRAVDVQQQLTLAEQSGDQMQAQKARDMQELAGRFEKKLHDLKLSRTISMQMAPQIRLIQSNNTVLIEKIQSSIVNSIPLWKNQIVIALGLSNSQKALQTQREVTDMTNALLVKNSEMLKQGSLEIAQESERAIVSMETLQVTNTNLIETITGVIDIQKKGSEERAAAAIELQKIEDELKHALLTASNR